MAATPAFAPRRPAPMLSPDARSRIARLGADLAGDDASLPALRDALAALDALPPEAVFAVEYEVAAAILSGCMGHDATHPGDDRHCRRIVMFDGRIEAAPDLAWILLFDSNGYVREAALRRLKGPMVSPFRVAALAVRLNDWAAPVRAAAVAAMRRCGVATDPGVIAAAAMALIERSRVWGRWGANERAELEALVARPDVAAALAGILAMTATGAPHRVLRLALRQDGLDGALPRLARTAATPAVRALALKALLEGRAAWHAGTRVEWIDKRYGIARAVPVWAERPIRHDLPLPDLIAAGIADPAASVRKIAADGLILHAAALGPIEPFVARLRADRNAAVRDRAAYLDRHFPAAPAPQAQT
ncbi:hypothetical protein C2U72_11215 [Prosthecomicrobium hirschii]|uniref:hypothetical protein n=1 Tax=Prosthecodimorpha hirschii TaxID=665126 RepID=UPI00112B4804|nr:hypothetical protein [Prosthecomicrobium hirschii]TPQ50875.1 hypothetical protein C2U72_11215 [Prosthecomicrobium hirschii]